MPLPAGSLNHRIIIQQSTKSTAASGHKRPDVWTDLTTRPIPASYRTVAGGETIRGRQVVATASALFEVRWLAAVAETDSELLRVKWLTGHSNPDEAPIFEILRCEDPDGIRDILMIHCKRVKQ
jgi:head-tail adaptor